MITFATNNRIGVLTSGGLDSSILVGHLLEQGRHVQPFYVSTDVVWSECELAGLRRFLETCQGRKGDLVTLDLPLADVYQDHWSITGSETPDAASTDEAVFLPGRNVLLIVKAAIWCQLNGVAELALASLETNPFDDASEEFFARLEAVLGLSGGRVRIVRPFAHLRKRQVMELGRHFDLHVTFSCISPDDGLHCGRCNKCAERQRAFDSIGLADATRYSSIQTLESSSSCGP